MHDRQDGDALLAHLVEHAEEVQLVAHVEVRRRLVEEEHRRLLREPARHERELPLAGGERPERAVAQVLDLGEPQRARDRGVVRGRERSERPAVRVAAERDAVADGEALGGLVLGGHEREAPRDRRARPGGERPAVEQHRAAGGRQQAGDRAHERRLAGRVRADERERLAGVQREGDAVQHAAVPAVDGERARLDEARSPAALLPAQREEEVGRADERGHGTERQLHLRARHARERGPPRPRAPRRRGTRPGAGAG